MSNMFLKIIHNLWPMIFIFTIIIISIRIAYLICNKQKFVLHKEIKMLFFLFYYTKNRNSFPEKVPAFIPQILRSSLTS